jgi:hypothetical protein
MNKKQQIVLILSVALLLHASSCKNQTKVQPNQIPLKKDPVVDVSTAQKPKTAIYEQATYDILPDKENLLITLKGQSGDNQKVTGLYQFNLKSKKTTRLFDRFPGTINIPHYLFDRLDPNNFIAEYQPQDNGNIQIGRFNKTKQYSPMVDLTTKDAEIVRIFTDQNLVFYTLDVPNKKSFCMMNMDGTNQKIIIEGNSLFVFTCLPLDIDKFFLDGHYEENTSDGYIDFSLIYSPKQNTYLWIKKEKMVEPAKHFVGIYQSQLLFALIKENSTEVSFEMVDNEGNQKKKFSVPLNYRGFLSALIDEPGNRLFFAYTSMDDKNKIVMIDLLTNQAKEIFSFENTRSDFGIHLNQTENILFCSTNIYPGYQEEIFHRISLDTLKEDTWSFPVPSSVYYSSDGNYLLSTIIDQDPSKHGIIDCKTKKVTLLKEKLVLTRDSYAIFVPGTRQFLVVTNNSDQTKYLYFIDLDGNLSKYNL